MNYDDDDDPPGENGECVINNDYGDVGRHDTPIITDG